MLEVIERLRTLKNGGFPFQGSGTLVDARLRILGREAERELLTGWKHETAWIVAARAFVEEDFDRAIDRYDEIGSLTDVALVQLRAAQKLVAAGQRSKAEVHLRSAMSFYRSRRATRFVREAETLLAATA
jgi:hypothetical protein